MYHTHMNTIKQQMMGLGGAFIIHNPNRYTDNKIDYFMMLQEFTVKELNMGEIKQGVYDIDPLSHDFNFLLLTENVFLM